MSDNLRNLLVRRGYPDRQVTMGMPSCVLRQRHGVPQIDSTPANISARLAATGFMGSASRDWCEIQAKGEEAEIFIYEEIGFDWMSGEGITSKSFAEQLASLGKVSNITLYINSPGGDVFDGLAIFNQLRRHKATINVQIDGVAASAASFVAMAGDSITMNEGALMMIHDAWGMFIGNADDGRKFVDQLDKVDGEIAEFYSARSGKPAAHFRDLMDSETWLTATEAVELGLADSVKAEERRKRFAARFQQLTNSGASDKN